LAPAEAVAGRSGPAAAALRGGHRAAQRADRRGLRALALRGEPRLVRAAGGGSLETHDRAATSGRSTVTRAAVTTPGPPWAHRSATAVASSPLLVSCASGGQYAASRSAGSRPTMVGPTKTATPLGTAGFQGFGTRRQCSLSSLTPSTVTTVWAWANTAATPARSVGASTRCVLTDNGCRAGSSRHDA